MILAIFKVISQQKKILIVKKTLRSKKTPNTFILNHYNSSGDHFNQLDQTSQIFGHSMKKNSYLCRVRKANYLISRLLESILL